MDQEQAPVQTEAIGLTRDTLEAMLARRLRSAVSARAASGIEEEWEEDQDQYEGIDELNPAGAGETSKSNPEARSRAARAGKSRVFLNITKPKVSSATARVTEMALPTDDRPWEFDPTPVPELDQAIEQDRQDMVTLGDGSQVPAADAARALVEKARKKAGRAQEFVDDWLTEGRVYAEIRRAIRDAGRVGTGVLKGPVPVVRQDRRWQTGPDGVTQLSIVERIAPTSSSVSCWDLFPDPSVTDNLHAGAYVWEREYSTAKGLREMAKMPGYDAEAIAAILQEGPIKVDQLDDRPERRTRPLESEDYEVFRYWGDLDPKDVITSGLSIKGVLEEADETDPEQLERRRLQLETLATLTTVPIVATLINGRLVHVAPNPLETGEFPFDLVRWETVEGRIWGRSATRSLRTPQRMLNASTRAMMENAGMAKGPQVVAMRELIEPADKTDAINGRKLWWFKPNADVKDVRAAFAVFNVEPIQPFLRDIINFSLEMADQLSNLPMLLQGMQGQATQTVGGMAMLEANATSPLKAHAKLLDDDLFTPHLSRYYDWLMQDPNVPEEAKGDLRIKPRAASVLVYRDFLANFLPQLLPFVKDPAFKLDPAKYIEELLRSNRFSPDRVQLSQEQTQAMEEQAANAQPPEDPRITAANINREAKMAVVQAEIADKAQDRQFKAEQADLDRAIEKYVTELEVQIQAMEFAGQREMSFDQLKAMLAAKSMDIKTKRELFAAERQFAVTSGEGRGL